MIVKVMWTIPSTNKIATELYECVLVNPENGMLAYPQVKKEMLL